MLTFKEYLLFEARISGMDFILSMKQIDNNLKVFADYKKLFPQKTNQITAISTYAPLLQEYKDNWEEVAVKYSVYAMTNELQVSTGKADTDVIPVRHEKGTTKFDISKWDQLNNMRKDMPKMIRELRLYDISETFKGLIPEETLKQDYTSEEQEEILDKFTGWTQYVPSTYGINSVGGMNGNEGKSINPLFINRIRLNDTIPEDRILDTLLSYPQKERPKGRSHTSGGRHMRGTQGETGELSFFNEDGNDLTVGFKYNFDGNMVDTEGKSTITVEFANPILISDESHISPELKNLTGKKFSSILTTHIGEITDNTNPDQLLQFYTNTNNENGSWSLVFDDNLDVTTHESGNISYSGKYIFGQQSKNGNISDNNIPWTFYNSKNKTVKPVYTSMIDGLVAELLKLYGVNVMEFN